VLLRAVPDLNTLHSQSNLGAGLTSPCFHLAIQSVITKPRGRGLSHCDADKTLPSNQSIYLILKLRNHPLQSCHEPGPTVRPSALCLTRFVFASPTYARFRENPRPRCSRGTDRGRPIAVPVARAVGGPPILTVRAAGLSILRRASTRDSAPSKSKMKRRLLCSQSLEQTGGSSVIIASTRASGGFCQPSGC